jgi:hypothetical protein
MWNIENLGREYYRSSWVDAVAIVVGETKMLAPHFAAQQPLGIDPQDSFSFVRYSELAEV